MIPIGRQATISPEIEREPQATQTLYQRLYNLFRRSSPVSPILIMNNPNQRPPSIFFEDRDRIIREYAAMRAEYIFRNDRIFFNTLFDQTPETVSTASEDSF